MILRYEGKNMVEQKLQDNGYLILKDSNNNKFVVKQTSEYTYQEGDLLLIRGIKTVGQNLQLQLTETGNVLRFTFQVNPNMMNYMAIHRDNQKIIKEKSDNQFTSIHTQYNDIAYLVELM